MAAKVLSALLAALPLLGCGNVEQRQAWAGWLQNVSQQMRSQPVMSTPPAPAPTPIGVTCFGRGNVASGMNKICYYDCRGSPAAITIGSAEICPLTIIH